MPRYEGLYEVCDRGQVRSLDRHVRHYLSHCGTALRVILSRESEQETGYIHKLVLEACHRDGTLRQVKLTPELVIACRARRAQGELYRTIAADYNVSIATIQAVVAGRHWSWVR